MHIALLNSRLLALSLVLLLYNDFYLKAAWPGNISGKLSDFAGISLVCLLLFVVFPKLKKISIVSVIVLFSWWKSEWSTPFIEFLHQAGFEEFNRTVDYSDLWAFLVIPICYYHSVNYPDISKRSIFGKVYYSIIAITSLFAITATSQIHGNYQSDFQFDNQASLITAKQTLAVVSRVANYYGYHCMKSCNSNSQRTYYSQRGQLEYTYNYSDNQILVRHTINPGGINLFFPGRDDIKFLIKIRKRISNGLKELNIKTQLKVIIKPDFYNPPSSIKPIVPTAKTIPLNSS